jgi:hypothetical protein
MANLADLLKIKLFIKIFMQNTIKIVKQLNPIIGEVLEDKIKEDNLDAFDKILANFIKLNIPTTV